MDKEILTFGELKLKKKNFYRHKTPIFRGDADIEKVLVSNKSVLISEKNLIASLSIIKII